MASENFDGSLCAFQGALGIHWNLYVRVQNILCCVFLVHHERDEMPGVLPVSTEEVENAKEERCPFILWKTSAPPRTHLLPFFVQHS